MIGNSVGVRHRVGEARAGADLGLDALACAAT